MTKSDKVIQIHKNPDEAYLNEKAKQEISITEKSQKEKVHINITQSSVELQCGY